MPTGSQKVLEVWTNRQIIDHAMLLKLQAKVDSIIVPPNIGRIPVLPDLRQKNGRIGPLFILFTV